MRGHKIVIPREGCPIVGVPGVADRHRIAADVADMLPADVPSFEYRHTPDPREIDQILLPLLEDIRGTLASQSLAEPSAPLRRSHEN